MMANAQKESITFSQREEAHWCSFRSAVSSLQNTLVQNIRHQLSSHETETSLSQKQTDTPLFDFSATEKNGATEPNLSQKQMETPLFDFSDVEKNDASEHNSMNSSNMVLPLNEDGNISQTAISRVASEALSNAEKQLADTKLLLALTEAERDELEFELMQSSR